MYFANPTYLWGLLALLAPLIIHLWSNKESHIIKVGSIKMFQEAESRNSKNFRLNEFWLLLLRMLAILSLVLIMADLRLVKDSQNDQIGYYFEENLLNNDRFYRMVDSLSEEKSVFLFKEGFPVFEEDQEVNEKFNVPDYWQLARSLEKESFDSAVVFSSGYLSGIKGKRPEIGKGINWINIDLDDSLRKPLALRKLKNSIQIIHGIGNSERLFYEKELISSEDERLKNFSSIPELWQEPYRIQMFFEDSLKGQFIFFQSAINAIQNYTGRQIELDSISRNSIDPETDLLIWLSDSEIPEFENRVLLLQKNDFAEDLIINGNIKNEFYLTQPISTERILKSRFSEELLNLIIPPEAIIKLSADMDLRKASEDLIKTETKKTARENIRIQYFSVLKYLWLLLFVLLIGERILAKIKRQ